MLRGAYSTRAALFHTYKRRESPVQSTYASTSASCVRAQSAAVQYRVAPTRATSKATSSPSTIQARVATPRSCLRWHAAGGPCLAGHAVGHCLRAAGSPARTRSHCCGKPSSLLGPKSRLARSLVTPRLPRPLVASPSGTPSSLRPLLRPSLRSSPRCPPLGPSARVSTQVAGDLRPSACAGDLLPHSGERRAVDASGDQAV